VNRKKLKKRASLGDGDDATSVDEAAAAAVCGQSSILLVRM